MSISASSIYKTLASSEIRLLTLEPGLREEPISCRLHHAFISDRPAYEALSYRWGDAQNRRQILVNGVSQSITAELATALGYLRHDNKPRVVWVDALCITPDDLQERSDQVRRMQDIFTTATRVVAWVGEAGRDGPAALAIMETVGGRCRALGGVPGYLEPADLEKVGLSLKTTDWALLREFLDRPYWERIWVAQELAASGTINAPETNRGIVMCGSRCIAKLDFDYTCLVLVRLFDQPTISALHAMVLRSSPFWDMAEGRRGLKGLDMFKTTFLVDGEEEESACRDLYGLVYLTARLKATDPRDKVYALLGIARESDRVIIPNYANGNSLEEVLMEMVKSTVARDRSLRFLLWNLIETPTLKPSWIPDPYRMGGGTGGGRAWLSNNFKASSNLKSAVEFDHQKRLMICKGVQVGIVGRVACVRTEDMESIYDLARYAQSLQESEHDTFWRTLMLDQDMSGGPTSPAPEEFGRRYRVAFKIAAGSVDVPEDFRPDLPPGRREVEYSRAFNDQWSVAIDCCCFIRTRCGKMGLGPFQSTPGDVVAILFGADKPVVLRPVGDCYQHIGEAYIHGGMRGEFVQEHVAGTATGCDAFAIC